MKSIDAFDTIKNRKLMFKYLDDVVEEIGEENVVQAITDNASNYVNARMRIMEKNEKIVQDSLNTITVVVLEILFPYGFIYEMGPPMSEKRVKEF